MPLTPVGVGGAIPDVGSAEGSPIDSGAPGAAPGAILRAMPGRVTRRDDAGAVVKDFVGDEPRDWWFERLRRLHPRSPARREHDSLRSVAELGLAVPACLGVVDLDPPRAWWPPRPGRGPRSRLRLTFVEHGPSVAEALARHRDPRLLEAVRALVVRLHAAGWYHRDLYLGHLVLTPEGRVVLFDLGRARRQERVRRRWFVKDLAALDLSSPSTVTRSDRLRFLRAWLAEVRGVDPADRRTRRRWARTVRGKARRLAAHAPRRSGAPDGPAEVGA